MMKFILKLALAVLLFQSYSGVELIRGVSLKHQSFYDPSRDFTCLDGSMTHSFQSVNDDYCDCPDGSDEPGTSACPQGRFYCENTGYQPLYLRSSRVNDGICDCCDGADEYDSEVACFNECQKFGAEAMERQKLELEEANAGFNAKQEFIREGKEKKSLKQKRFDEINQVLEERRSRLEELKSIKEKTEAPEKEAKDKHQKEWEEAQAKLKEERENIERGEAFALLDTDKDGWVTTKEMTSNNHLQADLPESEIQDLLGGETMVDPEKFVDVWSNIKPKFMKDGRPKTENVSAEGSAPEPAPVDIDEATPDKNVEEKVYGTEEKFNQHTDGDADGEDDDEDGDRGDDDDDDDDEREGKEEENHEESSPEKELDVPKTEGKEMPEYDEETKKLIQAADEARKYYEEEERKVKDLESEHSGLQKYLQGDFGPEEEFSALKGECFEFTDREYTYKLCPFEKVTQRSKNGGSETSLGTWEKWQEGSNYTRMKYSNGQGCWNGPSRSTIVRLSCGRENVLTMVSEPSRCEYEMEFKTPALCLKVEHPQHIEL